MPKYTSFQWELWCQYNVVFLSSIRCLFVKIYGIKGHMSHFDVDPHADPMQVFT